MSIFSGIEHIIREDEPMARHTWLRMGGVAKFFAEPTTQNELATLVTRCREGEVPIRLLGGGSNLLVREDGVDGVVIRLDAPAFCQITVQENIVLAGGGAALSHVISSAVREGLAGLEPLVGIPGTVGGALHGNSGRQHADIGPWTHSATTMTRTGEIVRRQRDDLQFSHGKSSLNELVILEAEFLLERESADELTKRMQKLWIVTKSKQPTVDQFAARIFKNPQGLRAADLVDQAGLRGAKVGMAEVSERNGNYVVAHPGASSEDVLQLAELMRQRVSETLGVELERDLEVW
ncbi:MAG: UDP-N-acetylmuramate dehydrogenase [Pirellulaceae bacterium]|nr:UDP-N-acetylmuramate dehydrogenase [Pirellulaceae bacterium]